MLGIFDGWGCFRKLVARLHARWRGGVGWYWCRGLVHGKSVQGVPTKKCLGIVVPIILYHAKIITCMQLL